MTNQDRINQFVNACAKKCETYVEVVRRLISEGVDINARHTQGYTGLQIAMRYNRIEKVRILLAQGDIQLNKHSEKDFNGFSALHWACYSFNDSSVESVRLFLAHPACTKDIVKMMNMRGETAEVVANCKDSLECARLIREYMEKVDKSEEADVVQRMVEMIKSTTELSPTRLENMTLTEVKEGIEKINATEAILEIANRKVQDEHTKELDKLDMERKIKTDKLEAERHVVSETHKRKVRSIVDQYLVDRNTHKKLRVENQERGRFFGTKLKALLFSPGHSAKPHPIPPSSLIPECPVCFEKMKHPLQIFNCVNGHLVCSVCRPKVTTNKCHCQAMYMGRATAMEQMVRQILGIM